MGVEAVRMAAVLGAGAGAVISGRTAAVHHGFLDRDRVIDVRCPDSRWNFYVQPPVGPRKAVHVRRSRSSEAGRVAQRRGIPVVSAAVALLQVAEELTEKQLKSAFINADMLGLLSDEELAWLTEPKRGYKGAGALRKLVLRRNPEVSRVKSVLEANLRERLAGSGLPMPEVNSPLAGYRADFHWKAFDLIVEVDGARYHRGVAKLNDDQDRENELVAIGNAILRFDWGQVEFEGAAVVALIEAALRRRGWSPGT